MAEIVQLEQNPELLSLNNKLDKNSGLRDELENSKQHILRLKEQRNALLDKIYEREIATLEVSSESDIDEFLDDDEINSELYSPKKKNAKKSTNIRVVKNAPGSPRRGVADEFKTQKSKRVIKTPEESAATPRKAITVPMDEHGKPKLPLTLGILTLHNLGEIVTDRPSYHNKRYVWPVGYKSSRHYLSAFDPNKQTTYFSTVVDGGIAPIFEVYGMDNPEHVFQSNTTTGVWSTVVKQANSIRGKEYTNSASGPDFFGFSNATISMLIEQLPGIDSCVNYQKKTFLKKSANEMANEPTSNLGEEDVDVTHIDSAL